MCILHILYRIWGCPQLRASAPGSSNFGLHYSSKVNFLFQVVTFLKARYISFSITTLFYYSSLSSTLLFLYSKMNNSCSSDCYVHFIHIACTNIIQNIESWVNSASLKERVTVAIAKCGEPLGMIHEWWASCKAILNHWLAKVTYRAI